jgi:hypothetical protein
MIDQYVFGKIVVDGRIHTRDLILSRDRVWEGWWREQGHRLSVADLKDVFEAAPEVLVVGTGTMGRMRVPVETRQEIERRGIELHVLPTGKACDLYNELEAGDGKVVAALHLTC